MAYFYSTVALVVLFSTCATSQAQVENKKDPKIAYIAAGIANEAAKIKSFESTTQYYHFEPKEVGAIFQELFPNSQLDSTKDKESLWLVRHWGNLTSQKSAVTYISGGWLSRQSTLYLLIEPAKAFTLTEVVTETKEGKESKEYQGSIVPRDMAFKDSFIGDSQKSDPRVLAYPAGIGATLDELLVNDRPAFYKGEETIDGAVCYKVERHITDDNRRVYWFDKERGFVVRRCEEREKVGDKWFPAVITQAHRIEQLNGVWLPTIVEKRVGFSLTPPYQKGGEKYGKLPNGIARDKVIESDGVLFVPGRFYRYTVENIRVNEPVAPENLQIVWPKNAMVYDRILNKSVQTGEPEKPTKPNDAPVPDRTPQ